MNEAQLAAQRVGEAWLRNAKNYNSEKEAERVANIWRLNALRNALTNLKNSLTD